MDRAIASAASALDAGDPLSALKYVALRDDPPALALRGIAMAQLGELPRALVLLRRAARAFGPRQTLERACCALAEAEVALAARELRGTARALASARAVFERRGQRVHALHAQLLQVRGLVLLGRVLEAEQALGEVALRGAPAALRARAHLTRHELALRRCQAGRAAHALLSARVAATRAGIPGLEVEVAACVAALAAPAARLIAAGRERPISLAEVEALARSAQLFVDGCRRSVGRGPERVPLTRRPVLFALLRCLAEAWPRDVSREALVQAAFAARRADASHRARLRVEVGRLRGLLRGLAGLRATARGFALVPEGEGGVVVLAPPVEGEGAALVALLADGERWSTSALALALGTSQRAVQRGLASLEAAGQVQASGGGKKRRWLLLGQPRFATTLLLPGAAPLGYDWASPSEGEPDAEGAPSRQPRPRA